MQHKEQESAGSRKISSGELTSARDLVNTELSAVKKYLAKLNDNAHVRRRCQYHAV